MERYECRSVSFEIDTVGLLGRFILVAHSKLADMRAEYGLRGRCGLLTTVRERHRKVTPPRKTVNNAFFFRSIERFCGRSCAVRLGDQYSALLIKALGEQHKQEVLKPLPAVPSGLPTDRFDVVAPDDLVLLVQAHFPAVRGRRIEENSLRQFFGEAFAINDRNHLRI